MILREIKNMYVPKIQQIEYLESTGTQYIDTEFKHNNNTRFVTLLSFQSVSSWNYPFGAFGDYNQRSIFALEIDYEKILYSYYGYIDAKKSFNQKIKLNYLYNIDFNKNTHTINDTSVVHNTSNFSSIYNTFIFASSSYDGTPTPINKVRCYYFQIYDNGTLVRDFIPVRIGTKGYMLDKVSGELYGNSGTGDFILGQDVGSINYSKNLQQIYQNKLIEGVDYETADWLKGDGTAYIDTNIIVNTATLKLEFECNNTLIENTKSACICGSRNYTGAGSSDTSIHYMYNGKYRLDILATDNNLQYSIHDIDSFRIDLSANTAVISGTTISSTKNHTNSSHTFRIFGCYLANTGYAGGLTNFKIDDGIHNLTLIPCQLLRSIPRNLDAQCKERVAGECGMIDLISGKFYGNVASSGTFTVENDNE